MAGQGLAQLASGITGSLFGGLLQDRQQEQEKKDRDLARQLAAYHALLEHADTPESAIPDILDAQAELLKVGPKFKSVTDHMRQAMQQRVPSGPERETAQSGVNRTIATSTAIDPTTDTLATGLNLRPTNATLISPGTIPTMDAEVPAAAQTVTTAPLQVVPPEPQMYQPTKAYGEMTQGEAADFRKSQSYIAQQKAMLDRQAQLAEASGDRAAERDTARQRAALDLQEKKNAGRIAAVDETFAQKKKALGAYDTAAAAAADKQRLALELQLRAGGMDPTEAKERSGTILSSNMEAILDQHKAKAERDRAEIGHWRNIDSARLTAQGGAATAGMTAAQARTFRANVTEVLPELNSVRGELERLKTLQAQMGTTADPAVKARIDELEKRHTDLLLQVKGERDKVLATQPTVSRVPSAPGAASSSAPPSAGTFDMKGWSRSHSNASDAERNAIRAKARARNLAVVE